MSFVVILCAAGYAQQADNKGASGQIGPPPQEERPAGREKRARVERQGYEQKVVRDAYVRLMRYHSAARDEQAATDGVSFKPEDYVIFELRDMHTGPIEEIYDRQAAELITNPDEEVLKVTPHHLQHGNGPKHAYYDMEWSKSLASAQYNEKLTVVEMLRSRGDRLADVEGYTSYEVTVRLGGKQRTYRAVALHHKQIESSAKAKAEIVDQITTEMNGVIGNESPRVRSPWAQYIKSSLYLAVARAIRNAERAGRPFIPVDAPIGYLPGDDLDPATEAGKMGLAVVCATVEITNISPGTLNVSTGDAASAHTLTVDFTPAGTSASISFQATFAGNYGGSSQASLTIPTVTGTSPVTSTVKAGGVDSSGAFSVQPAADGNLSPKETRVIVPPQILLQMFSSEAGSLPSSTVRPLLGWSIRNRFSDQKFFSGQTTYRVAITQSATVDTNLKNGRQPELDSAASVFDGYIDPSDGCQGFWSPTTTQWTTVNQALGSRTPTLPNNIGIPFTYNQHPEKTQIVYFSSVGPNTRPGYTGAPTFVFVRKRDPNANPPLPAVVQID